MIIGAESSHPGRLRFSPAGRRPALIKIKGRRGIPDEPPAGRVAASAFSAFVRRLCTAGRQLSPMSQIVAALPRPAKNGRIERGSCPGGLPCTRWPRSLCRNGIRLTAVRYGTYLGYDHQFGNLVAGLEGAFGDAVNARRMHIGVPGLGGTLPGFGNTDSVTVTSRWDASVVARLGALIAPDTLVYGLGGVAFQNVRIDAVCGSTLTGECFLDHAESLSTTRTGWTVGTGLETMFAPHWLARFDYRYADLGTIHHTFFVSEVIQSPVAATHVRTHTASFGLAYKFGPGL